MNGFRRFLLVGRTTDGRKWFEVVHLADEFIESAGLKLLLFVIGPVLSWDERHGCTTRSFTFQQFSEIGWALFSGDWDGEDERSTTMDSGS